MTDRVTAKLIRLQADGELTPEQAEHLCRCLEAHPEDEGNAARCANFEQRLRECVGRVLEGDAGAPTSLNLRIRAAMAEFGSDESPAAGERELEPIQSEHEAPERMKFSLFSNPRRANIFAVAATLAIVAGAILYGIFGQSIDDLPLPPQVDLIAESAAYASTAHDSLAAQATAKDPFQLSLADQAREELTAWLGVPSPVFDLQDVDYQFVGAKFCETPLSKRSGVLVYESVQTGDRKPKVTITLVPKGPCKKACAGLEPGKWVPKGKDGKTLCNHVVMCSTDRRLVYFVVCCRERDLNAVVEHISQSVDGIFKLPERIAPSG